MRQLLTLLFVLCVLFSEAQKTADPELNQRLQDYMTFNKQKDFSKVMDYIHPKLFAIAPREAILASFEQAFNSDEMEFSFDSMAVTSVSPVYKYQNAFYRKVTYHMSLVITLNDSTDLKDKELATIMAQSFKSAFPGKKIAIDAARNAVKVAGTELMFAIKDKDAAQWMFLGYEKKNPQLVQHLYPKQVRVYFKL